MIGRRHIESSTKSGKQTGPELGAESRIAVRDNRDRESMEADYVLEEHIGEVSSGTGGATGDEVRGFREAVDKDGDSIVLSFGLR